MLPSPRRPQYPLPKPLKQRYPWRLAKEKRMTIAAGLLCQDGLIVCADMEHSTWSAKTYHSKMNQFEYPGGKVVFALAGNRAFALTAMEKIQRKLKRKKPSEDALDLIEAIVDKEYRRQVISNPAQAADGSLHYSIILGHWVDRGEVFGDLNLYASYQGSLHEVKQFECLGAGSEIAEFAISPGFMPSMPMWDAWNLAAYGLTAAKEYVPGCGGPSIFAVMERTGSIGVSSTRFGPSPIGQVEEFFKRYEFLTRRLLISIANPSYTGLWADVPVNTFLNSIDKVRQEWAKHREEWIDRMAEANPLRDRSFAANAYLRISMGLPLNPPDLFIPEEDQQHPQSTTDAPLLEPPSPELPGGSGES